MKIFHIIFIFINLIKLKVMTQATGDGVSVENVCICVTRGSCPGGKKLFIFYNA